jgi:hypothetical protein
VSAVGLTSGSAVPSLATVFAERAPTLTLPRKRERGWTAFGAGAPAARSAVIEAQGFKVLRFSNHDVMINRTGALETIAAAVAERAPTPTLPCESGQEKQTP